MDLLWGPAIQEAFRQHGHRAVLHERELLSSFPASGAPLGPHSEFCRNGCSVTGLWLPAPRAVRLAQWDGSSPGLPSGQMLWCWDRPTAIGRRWRNRLVSAVFTHRTERSHLKKKRKWFCLFPKLFVNNFASKIGSQANAITQVW